MDDLRTPLSIRTRDLVQAKYAQHAGLLRLANAVSDDNTDFEHIITFLDDSPSPLYRHFAAELRSTFEDVLRERLETIEAELKRKPVELYAAAFDVHNLPYINQTLGGVLTTNYDLYIELALEKAGFIPIDFGFQLGAEQATGAVRLLKLHGSFNWKATSPPTLVEEGATDQATLWIPPGIEKAKAAYPFGVLWDLAREVLNCDVLRIVGCRLDGNDWDLISLIFNAIHARTEPGSCRVEIIDSPRQAQKVKRRLPYLGPRSIFELDNIGEHIVGEAMEDGVPRKFLELSEGQQQDLIASEGLGPNWFDVWLRHQAEWCFREHGSVETPTGNLTAFLEEVT